MLGIHNWMVQIIRLITATNIIYANTLQYIIKGRTEDEGCSHPTCYTNSTEGTICISIWKQPATVFLCLMYGLHLQGYDII